MRLFNVPRGNLSGIRAAVRGIFEEKGGTLVFLNYANYEVDTSLPFRRYLTVEVGDERVQVKPVDSFDLVLSPRE
jgi:hypothetical protein